MHHQPSDIISLTDDVITTTEETDRQIISTSSMMTQPLSPSETVIIPISFNEKKSLNIYCFIQNEAISVSSNQDDEIILEKINELINDIVQSASSELQQNSIDTDSGLTQSIIPQVKI